ncbi:MAG TPA: NUDIX hydrolase [Actinomycetota bacterium]|nr:NUDIX hydrolase [Actinomycetota bacterium]
MDDAGRPREGDPGEAAAGGAKRRRRRRKRPSAKTGAGSSGQRSRATQPSTATRSARASRSDRSTTASQAAEPAGRTRKRRRPRSRASGAKKNQTRKTQKKKAPNVPTKREISAGGVVYRRDGDEIEIVLASRRTRRGQLAWGLAKGGIEEDESMEDAAIREVREETGLLAEIEASLGETRYMYVWEDVRIRKTVHFFLMRHTGGDVDDRDDEMEEIRWFSLERALKRAAYRGERDMLARAAEMLR